MENFDGTYAHEETALTKAQISEFNTNTIQSILFELSNKLLINVDYINKLKATNCKDKDKIYRLYDVTKKGEEIKKKMKFIQNLLT